MKARRFSREARTHLIVGAIVCVALPLASRVEGARTFAWTMFAASGEYRIEIVEIDDEGRARSMNPTALAEHAAPSAVRVLGGADHWRRGASVATLRTHLDDLAAYACDESHAATIEVTLRERAHDGAAERATTARRACRR